MADRNWRFAVAAVVLPLLFMVISGVARAATFTVTNTTDPASPMAGDGSLREAIINANSAGGINTIQFNAGVTGTITLGSTLPAIVSGNTLTITGPTASPRIAISGGHAVRLMVVLGGATLTLQFLTMEDGTVTGATNSNGQGGGIDNFGTLIIANSTLSGNQAIGGVGFAPPGGLSIGAMGLGGAIRNNGTLTITNSTLSANQAIGGAGSFLGGEGSGGAIDNNIGSVTVTNSTLSGNQATGGAGPHIQGGVGGAISNVDFLTVTNSTFSGNQATGAGAIFDNGLLTVTNSTFSGNQASFAAGAIFELFTLTVTNSTFSGNQAGVGGAIDFDNEFDDGVATLNGSILADSTGGNCNTTITDGGYNIADDDSCGFIEAPSGTSINNSTTLHLDPAGLRNNGGPTNTIALEPNSEAVDFIPVAECTDQSMPPVQLTTDQRGFPRPDPGNPNFCDAGAFELQTMPFVLAPNSERVQIARSRTPDSDQVNMAFTFIENASPTCDAADNAFNGVDVDLLAGSCETHDHTGLFLSLAPWVVHTVNHQSYGTFFIAEPPATLSARMVALLTPAAPACGEWTVNIELAGIDSSDLGNGPFSLVLSNSDGDTGCFDITNAIVGNQIPTPGHSVRRGVRR
jgi:hypothetical protein